MDKRSGTNAFIKVVPINVRESSLQTKKTSNPAEALSEDMTFVRKNFCRDDIIPWFDKKNNHPERMMTLVTSTPSFLPLMLTLVKITNAGGLTLFGRDEKGKIVPLQQHNWPPQIKDFYVYNDLYMWAYNLISDMIFLANAFPLVTFSQGAKGKNVTVKRRIVELGRRRPMYTRKLKKAKKEDPQKYIHVPEWTQEGIEKEAVIYMHMTQKAFFDENYAFVAGGNTFQHDQGLFHLKEDIPGFSDYAIPRYYGGLKSAQLQKFIIDWQTSNLRDSMVLRAHVQISDRYFAAKLQDINPETKQKYTRKEISEEVGEMVDRLFHDPEKAFKTLLSGVFFSPKGEAVPDIRIEAIKIDFKDEAFVELEKNIRSLATSAVGLLPSLAGFITEKGMSSGSEMTQSLNLQGFLGWHLRQMIVNLMECIHRYNGWDEEYTWGFPMPALVTKDIDKGGITDAT